MKPFVFILIALFTLSACEREEFSEIPYAPVRVDIDLGFEDMNLQTATGYKMVTTPRTEAERGMLGYGGILVCHGILETNNAHNLWAFDLSCPVEAQRAIRIVPDDPKHSGFANLAQCPQCGAVFDIAFGGVAISGSKFNLTRYAVNPLNGSLRFRISN